jgi:hypothetical protein|tara:strand:- start:788 stop:1246 length:459 start_codon:yes stop_codon:yes gene_type:complete
MVAEIWVDADACPNVIKEILFRAADRQRRKVTLVANHPLKRPPSPWIEFLQVPKGFDVADTTIEERCAPGDLVVTQDIPLADAVITLGATALSPRGVLFTRENIRERLNMRDFMDTMRASGIEMSQPPVLSNQDRQKFANGLDKWLRQTASS